ncbi:MAG: hypothetical protein KGH74_05435 [Candidatus Micrarchaeota archaeon]|nr:hypothetical protein [Candidatus Micrarchaeota archaeon]
MEDMPNAYLEDKKAREEDKRTGVSRDISLASVVGVILGLVVTFFIFSIVGLIFGISLGYLIIAIIYVGIFAYLMKSAIKDNKKFIVGYCLGSTGIIIGIIVYEIIKSEIKKNKKKTKAR